MVIYMINFKIKVNNKEIDSIEIEKYIKKWQLTNAVNYIISETGCTKEEATDIVNEFKTNALHKSEESVEKWKMNTNPQKDSSNHKQVKVINKTIIECPYCGSSNTKKISSISRISSIIGMGIFSKKIGKRWHCNNCNSNF